MTGDLVAALQAQRLVPIIRTERSSAVPPVVDSLVRGGCTLFELTMTIPDPIATLERVRRDHPDATIGMGTVTSVAQAQEVIDEGASFIVTPFAQLEIIETGRAAGTPVIAGALSPTEIHQVLQAGASAAKIFPCGRLGPGYVKDLIAVLPGASLLPTGGISASEVPAYLDAGATAVGLASSLTGAALAGGPEEHERLETEVRQLLITLAR